MSYDRDTYMRRQDADHAMIAMRDPSRDVRWMPRTALCNLLPSNMSPSVTLHREVNALGGAPSTDFDRGYCEAIGHVLAILERRGFTEAADVAERQS